MADPVFRRREPRVKLAPTNTGADPLEAARAVDQMKIDTRADANYAGEEPKDKRDVDQIAIDESQERIPQFTAQLEKLEEMRVALVEETERTQRTLAAEEARLEILLKKPDTKKGPAE